MNAPLRNMFSRLPADYETPELVEARTLAEDAAKDHTEALTRANALSEELDRACELKATADRTYGAAPTQKNRDSRLAAQTTIDDLQLQLDAATESVVEFEEPLAAAKAHLARVETSVLAHYQAEQTAKSKAQARNVSEALHEVAVILNRDHGLVPFVRAELDDLTNAALDAITRRAH